MTIRLRLTVLCAYWLNGPAAEKKFQTGSLPPGLMKKLSDLCCINLLNDRDFAEQWVQSRSRKYGSSRISRELRMKGIDEDTASEVLENLPDDEQLLHATDFAAKKIRTRRSGEDPQKLKQRVTAAIVRRGYSWSIALKAYHCALLQEETNAD